MGYKLAESCVDGASRQDETSSHFGNVVGHYLDFIVEDGTHTSRHLVGLLTVCEAVADLRKHGEIWICFKQLEIRLSNVGNAALRWSRSPEPKSRKISKKESCVEIY